MSQCKENLSVSEEDETDIDMVVPSPIKKHARRSLFSQSQTPSNAKSNTCIKQQATTLKSTSAPTSKSTSATTSKSSATTSKSSATTSKSSANAGESSSKNVGSRRLSVSRSPNMTPLAELSGNQELLRKILTNQEKIFEQNNKLAEHYQQSQREQGSKIKVTPEIRQAVREAYSYVIDQSEEEEAQFKKWNFRQGRRDPKNIKTSEEVQRCVKGWHPNTKACEIKVAVDRYYRSLYEQHLRVKNRTDEMHKARQRVYERRKRKLKARSSVLEKTSQLNDEQKTKYRKVLTMDYMSSEYSGTDEDNSQLFVISKLSWRSDEVSKIFYALDEKHESALSRSSRRMLNRRAEGQDDSKRSLPRKFPIFSVKKKFLPG